MIAAHPQSNIHQNLQTQLHSSSDTKEPRFMDLDLENSKKLFILDKKEKSEQDQNMLSTDSTDSSSSSMSPMNYIVWEGENASMVKDEDDIKFVPKFEYSVLKKEEAPDPNKNMILETSTMTQHIQILERKLRNFNKYMVLTAKLIHYEQKKGELMTILVDHKEPIVDMRVGNTSYEYYRWCYLTSMTTTNKFSFKYILYKIPDDCPTNMFEVNGLFTDKKRPTYAQEVLKLDERTNAFQILAEFKYEVDLKTNIISSYLVLKRSLHNLRLTENDIINSTIVFRYMEDSKYENLSNLTSLTSKKGVVLL
ncbi:hypothetical protein DFJ63DRAFT_337967 [Scheffersomyces coipomensis]|uniref:uncharacterized protein n=1 Tax=Scheffersomyces coipomensis TaxID=1788519 RepID=UPI00315D6347